MTIRILMVAAALASAGCDGSAPNAAEPAQKAAPGKDAGKIPAAGPAPAPAPHAEVPAEEEGECGAVRLAGYVGRAYAAPLGPELKRASGAASVRLQTPANTAPIDVALAPRRLNVILDPGGRIAEFSCG